MRKYALTFLALYLLVVSARTQVTVQHLRCDNLADPIGIDTKQPQLSWQLVSAKRNTLQTAYEVTVNEGKTVVWKTGKVQTDQSVHVPYGGDPLVSDKKYSWRVRVWDNQGKVSPWSEVAFFHTAFLYTTDWKAKWMEAGFAEDTVNRPAQYFRKKFSLNKKVVSARAFITAHGMYEAQLNGKRIGDYYLTPGWTSYNKRLQYQVYDVTSLLLKGDNAVGVITGNGWYRGYLAWNDKKNIYGNKQGVLLQLVISYSDGTTETISSDETWKSSTGAITYAEIYHGETIDARLEKTGWSTAAYNDASWSPVRVAMYPNDNLLATVNEPVKKHEVLKPVRFFTTPKGEKIIDFGQNLVGWVMVKATGKAGDKINIQHAEVLDKQGNFYIDNLRIAKATANYILKGGEEEHFESHFTFYGFRYIRVNDYPGEIKPENFEAVALHSNMAPTGSFSCSDSLINQLQHNIQWGQKGNFLDVPTDCPQRDERLGWTGDAQVFSRTAAFNFGVNNFFAKWLKDVAADQQPNGSVPHVIPNVLGPGAGASAGWADVATIIPWNIYRIYGDKKVLEDQYNSMKAWVDYMESKSKDGLWNTGSHYGDWLFYRPFDDNDGKSAVTDKYLIAQCFFARSTQLLINTAIVLNKKEDEEKYKRLLQIVKEAFVREYITANGRLVSGTQTAYVLALNFDMLPESQRQQAAERLVKNIKDYGTHLTTGFLGTPYLCDVLTRFGYADIAYSLLMQKTYPSWLYPVTKGATTIWERWNGVRPDGSFEPATMNSFNHYAYGAIGDWMYRVVAGLDMDDVIPGYKHIVIKPIAGGGLTWASASLQTGYGKIVSGWKIENGKLVLDIEIPVNTTATIYIPAKEAGSVTESGKTLAEVKETSVAGTENGRVIVKAGSGTYHFEVNSGK